MGAVAASPSGYRATRTADELVVHRVPIFVECERSGHNFDSAWITSAVAEALKSAAGGHHPPLHVRHHEVDSDSPPVSAGYFTVLGAEPITFRGTQRLAIFADLHVTNPGVAEDILRRRLPYRSVELFVDSPEITSCALLDHEAPYLKLPMLMVNDVRDQPGAAAFSFDRSESETGSSQPLYAFRTGNQACLLFRDDNALAIETMKTKTPAAQKPAMKFESDAKKDDEKKDDEKMEDGGGGTDVKTIVKAIESGSISVADMDAILAAIASQRSTSEAEDSDKPAPAPVPGGEAMSANVAKLIADNEIMRARLDAIDATEKRKTDIAAAMQRLHGRQLGSDIEARLVKLHEEHGAKGFSAVVDILAQSVAPMHMKGGPIPAGAGNVPPVAMKFAEHGTDAVDQAARFAEEWQFQAQRGGIRGSLEDYVMTNMRHHLQLRPRTTTTAN